METVFVLASFALIGVAIRTALRRHETVGPASDHGLNLHVPGHDNTAPALDGQRGVSISNLERN